MKNDLTIAQLEQQAKEFSETLGFDNPIAEKEGICPFCKAKDLSPTGYCYDCGETTNPE